MLISVNCLFLVNYAGYIYFGLWPTDDLIRYLAPPLLHQINLDLYYVPFAGTCLKVGLTQYEVFYAGYSTTKSGSDCSSSFLLVIGEHFSHRACGKKSNSKALHFTAVYTCLVENRSQLASLTANRSTPAYHKIHME